MISFARPFSTDLTPMEVQLPILSLKSRSSGVMDTCEFCYMFHVFFFPLYYYELSVKEGIHPKFAINIVSNKFLFDKKTNIKNFVAFL